jgi:YHS domain-containing protein
VKDPTTYLRNLGVSMTSALNDRVPARIENEYLSRVNYEAYYFAELAEKRRFDGDPARFCGFVTDPVSKERFRPRPESPRAEFAGRPWFFVSDANHMMFEAMPDSFLSPRYSMKPAS